MTKDGRNQICANGADSFAALHAPSTLLQINVDLSSIGRRSDLELSHAQMIGFRRH